MIFRSVRPGPAADVADPALAEQGLELLADEPAERRERLQEMRDFYAFFEEELPVLLDRWEAERKES